ncbi:MAG: hypothetical protein ACTHOD_02615 [Motilibacteraceae bacterium]
MDAVIAKTARPVVCATPSSGLAPCDNCGSPMRWETSHQRCDACGHIVPCCEGAPLS